MKNLPINFPLIKNFLIFWGLAIIILAIPPTVYLARTQKQQTQWAQSAGPTEAGEVTLRLGVVTAVQDQSFSLSTETDTLTVALTDQTLFYETSQAGCDIKINPNCGGVISESTRDAVLQEGVAVTVAGQQTDHGFLAERVNLISSR